MAHHFERRAIFTVDWVLNQVPNKNEKGKTKTIHGVRVSFGKKKLRLFKRTVPLMCSFCGIKGLYFALEKHEKVEKNGWHFNLYGIKDGKETMLTVDHIIPKAHGGSNKLTNMQVLCEPCNVRKGSRIYNNKRTQNME